MLTPERDPASIPTEHLTRAFEHQVQGRHSAFGEYALNSAANIQLLPELGTAHEYVYEQLKARVAGQDQAIEKIVSALDRAPLRAEDDHRPIANLAFLGPTGTGKTQMARVLADVLGIEGRLIKIDASAYKQGHETASLTGSPPGYKGDDRTPILSADNIERDNVVLLVDEVEKGSEALDDVLLQIMDEDKLTLHSGEVVSFRKAIVIVTSNLGAHEMQRQTVGRAGFNASSSQDVDIAAIERAAVAGFKGHFKPEFVNRFDELIVFHGHSESSLRNVLKTKLATMNQMYADKFGVRVSLSRDARKKLIDRSLEQIGNGARPLVRAIQDVIEAPLGRYIANGILKEGTEIRIYHRDELEDEVSDTHKGEYIFTACPDPSIIKKVYIQPPSIEPGTLKASTSTDVVTVPNNSTPEEQ